MPNRKGGRPDRLPKEKKKKNGGEYKQAENLHHLGKGGGNWQMGGRSVLAMKNQGSLCGGKSQKGQSIKKIRGLHFPEKGQMPTALPRGKAKGKKESGNSTVPRSTGYEEG